MKILDFFLFLWVIFALLDPDPATQINADPCKSETRQTESLKRQEQGIRRKSILHAEIKNLTFSPTTLFKTRPKRKMKKSLNS
jgi:hypothetical protein